MWGLAFVGRHMKNTEDTSESFALSTCNPRRLVRLRIKRMVLPVSCIRLNLRHCGTQGRWHYLCHMDLGFPVPIDRVWAAIYFAFTLSAVKICLPDSMPRLDPDLSSVRFSMQCHTNSNGQLCHTNSNGQLSHSQPYVTGVQANDIP